MSTSPSLCATSINGIVFRRSNRQRQTRVRGPSTPFHSLCDQLRVDLDVAAALAAEHGAAQTAKQRVSTAALHSQALPKMVLFEKPILLAASVCALCELASAAAVCEGHFAARLLRTCMLLHHNSDPLTFCPPFLAFHPVLCPPSTSAVFLRKPMTYLRLPRSPSPHLSPPAALQPHREQQWPAAEET